ncbi:MAG: carbohydrate ABC transporter permease [Paenibacillaceae bacterium]|nr:carbohydrate ABC transporter permease [Paenibacillaceae bacterium]
MLLLLVCALMVFPIYYVVMVSFTDASAYRIGELHLFPQKWSLRSYTYLFSTQIVLSAFKVSVFLATIGTALSLIVTSGLSYAISRKSYPARRVVMLLILLTILFHPGIIPNYLVVKQMGLINSVWALILPALTSGWYVLLMKGFFDSISETLREAAELDGYNDLQIFLRIVLPLSLPAIAAFGLFYAVGYWNTFFTAILYINAPGKWPLQLFLQNMLVDPQIAGGGTIVDISERNLPGDTLKMAAVVVTTVPILAAYPFLQKYFAKGAMVGSVKE